MCPCLSAWLLMICQFNSSRILECVIEIKRSEQDGLSVVYSLLASLKQYFLGFYLRCFAPFSKLVCLLCHVVSIFCNAALPFPSLSDAVRLRDMSAISMPYFSLAFRIND
jgi:hypothetical protein